MIPFFSIAEIWLGAGQPGRPGHDPACQAAGNADFIPLWPILFQGNVGNGHHRRQRTPRPHSFSKTRISDPARFRHQLLSRCSRAACCCNLKRLRGSAFSSARARDIPSDRERLSRPGGRFPPSLCEPPCRRDPAVRRQARRPKRSSPACRTMHRVKPLHRLGRFERVPWY